MKFLRGMWLIARKDIASETRTLQRLSSMLFLALTILVIFSFALDFSRRELADLAAGVFWVTLSLSAVLSLHDSFRIEREDQALWALLLAPIDESAIYLGKLLSNLLLLVGPGILILILSAVFFNLDLGPVALELGAVIVLNTLGFAALGTLFATLSSRTRRGEILLHLLLLPLSIPLILAAVRATTPLLLGRGLAEVGHWLQLTMIMDVAFITAGVLLFEYLTEE
ncbi:MAG: heme exporter protein CcmB [Acidobacteriota bacterium]